MRVIRGLFFLIAFLLLVSLALGEDRKKPSVVIECANGMKKIFSNDYSDLNYGGDILHILELNIGNRFSFVSKQSGHGEDFSMILINKSNCTETYLDGMPIYNKENDKLIMHWFDIEAGFNWNGLKIYSLAEDSLKLEYEVSPDIWGPRQPKWIGKNKILFDKVVLNKKWKKEGDPIYLEEKYELNFKSGKWLMAISPSE